MSFEIESIRFQPTQPAWNNFLTARTGVVGKDLYKRGLRLQMLAKQSAPKRSGLLAASIRVNYKRGAANPSVIVGSSLPYAYWVHEGTRPHLIRVKRNRQMRFVVRGRVIYAEVVNHPGSRADKFLSRHLRTVVR